MSQRYAIPVFAVTVLLICGGAYAAGRWLLPPGQVEPGGRPAWTPPASAPTARSAASPTVTVRPAASPTPARATLAPTPTAAPTFTAAFTSTPEAPIAFAFALRAEVRHSTGDCPGAYILGRVTDAQARPLAGVRLQLVDEYGNQQTQISKSGANEVGRYDFPLFGPPRRFYLSVVDAQNRPLSPVIEIPHGVGGAPQATCHWADWQRR